MKQKNNTTDSLIFRNVGMFLNDPMWPFKEIILDEKTIYNSSYQDRYEVSEEKDSVNLEISLPGINKDEVEVEIDNELLKIRVHENNNRKWIKSYSKDFSIGNSLDLESARVSMSDGILLVTFEKKSKNRSKRLTVL